MHGLFIIGQEIYPVRHAKLDLAPTLRTASHQLALLGERVLPVAARAGGAIVLSFLREKAHILCRTPPALTLDGEDKILIAKIVQLHLVELPGQLVGARRMSIGVGEKCPGGELGYPVRIIRVRREAQLNEPDLFRLLLVALG